MPEPASKSIAKYKEGKQSVSHYITSSQEFLNRARFLANNNQNQTPEDKEKIIKTINTALDLANQAIDLYPSQSQALIVPTSDTQNRVLILIAKKAASDNIIQSAGLKLALTIRSNSM